MLDQTCADTRIRYLFPEELADIHEGLFPESAIRTFGLTTGLLLCTDNVTGEQWKASITPEQAAAIFWLLINSYSSDDSQSLVTRYMYEIAESALINCPPKMRPIP